MNIKTIGILTSGGDCPGLNAAIRGVAKPMLQKGVKVIGFLDGFRGLVEDRTIVLGSVETSGLLVQGGTILGTSRFKPHKFPGEGSDKVDRVPDAIKTYKKHNLDALVIIGGGGTQKNAFKLIEAGIKNIVTLPKTIDNDVWGTDSTFGFDSGMTIACEAIDRLHTTASSHHRCMFVDIMGHNTGWLALASGIAGGADLILIPEFPFEDEIVIESLRNRERQGKTFSIVAVAEGAISVQDYELAQKILAKEKTKKKLSEVEQTIISSLPLSHRLAALVESELKIESRVTTLGHLQRGGIPTPTDRILATNLGAKAAECIFNGCFGMMIASRGNDFVPVPLEEVVGKKKYVTVDHPLVKTAKQIGISLGANI